MHTEYRMRASDSRRRPEMRRSAACLLQKQSRVRA